MSTTQARFELGSIIHDASEKRDWHAVVTCDPQSCFEMWNHFSSISVAGNEDMTNAIFGSQKGMLMQARWSAAAICEQLLHCHIFAHRQQFAAIGSSATIPMIQNLSNARICLLSKTFNFRDQARAMCQLATLLINTDKTKTYGEATNLLNGARLIAEDYGFISIESITCCGLGRVAFEQNKIPEALDFLRNSVVAAALSEIGGYTLETDALYELAVVLGNSEDDSSEELGGVVDRLRAMCDTVPQYWSLPPIHLDGNMTPSTSRQVLEPWVCERTLSVCCMEQARLMYVEALLRKKQGDEQGACEHVAEMFDYVLITGQDPKSREYYDLLRGIRVQILKWPQSDALDELVEQIAATMVTLLSQMAQQKRSFVERLDKDPSH
jgi:hypothetical protein